ncbi:cupin domain-containing protein [Thiolapillus sp.]
MNDQGILLERNPSPLKLEVMGVENWGVWKKEKSTFPWTYHQQETCYILRGRFIVTPEGGEPMEFGRGDLITFPTGMKCTWEILEDVEKYYDFQ